MKRSLDRKASSSSDESATYRIEKRTRDAEEILSPCYSETRIDRSVPTLEQTESSAVNSDGNRIAQQSWYPGLEGNEDMDTDNHMDAVNESEENKISDCEASTKENEPSVNVAPDVFREKLERHRVFVEERMDPNYGLVDRLRGNDAIGYLQWQMINAESVPFLKSRKILDFILEGSASEKVVKLCEALRETKQMHLINYVDNDGVYNSQVTSEWPLSEREIKIIDTNFNYLTERIVTADGLLMDLVANNTITQRQKECINALLDSCQRNSALLDILRRGSLFQYTNTIKGLQATNQGYIAKFLMGEGILAVHATANGEMPFIKDAEAEIVNQLTSILRDMAPEEKERLLELAKLHIFGLIGATVSKSIVLFFHCKNLSDFLRLKTLLDTKELQKIVEIIYNKFLPNSTIIEVTLTWNNDEFNKVKRFLEAAEDSDGRTPKFGRLVIEQKFHRMKRSLDRKASSSSDESETDRIAKRARDAEEILSPCHSGLDGNEDVNTDNDMDTDESINSDGEATTDENDSNGHGLDGNEETDTDNESDESINSDGEATTEENESSENEMEDVSEVAWSYIISDYILEACQQNSRSWHIFNHCVNTRGRILCGSEAEFYIEPLRSCVDDKDFLEENPKLLAFPDDVPLWPDFVRNLQEHIKCYRIVPYSRYPSFVKLLEIGTLKYNWDRRKYNFLRKPEIIGTDSTAYIIASTNDSLNIQLEGPAIRDKDINYVPSIHCSQWPKEASEWPNRPRKYNWPTKDIIMEVVRRGCHIVYVQHRDCRDDDLQWRLSFSVAEVLLLRSWTPNQQIVYHMLRFFAKKEKLIQKDCPKEKEVLCTYHFKTLMLWACEQKSPEWWVSTVRTGICCELLRKLSKWLRKRRCPNYFIPKANLFYKNTDLKSLKTISKRVNYFCNVSHLNQWFVTNYIFPEGCEIRRIFKTMPSRLVFLLETQVHLTAEMKQALFEKEISSFHSGYLLKLKNHLNSDNIVLRENSQYSNGRIQGTDVSSQLVHKERIHFESALFFLAAPNAISCGKVTSCSNFISDVIRLVSLLFVPDWWFHYHNFPKNYESRLEKSFVYFVKAQEFLGNLYGCLSDTEFELRYRMSMEFLRKSVRSEDSSSDAVRCAVVVFAAAICYAKSQYQAACDMCSTILTISSANKEPMNAGCLLFNEDVARIVGFLVLCKRVRDSSRREFDLDLRISPNVFAQCILLQSTEKMSKDMQIDDHDIKPVYLLDALLLAKMKSKLSALVCVTNSNLCKYRLCVYPRSDSLNELVEGVTGFSMNDDICVQLFMECSLEKLACFYQSFSERFGLHGNTVGQCYRALYLYNSRKYDEAMKLCEEVLHESELDFDFEKFSELLLVWALPPFLAFFDEDIQCIIGLQLVAHFLYQLNYDIERYQLNYEIERNSTDETQTAQKVICPVLVIDALRRQYLIRKHFVARYLTLRCLIDCKSSVSEIRRAFGELQPQLPLEHSIRQFLLRKVQPFS